jgi:hypothetical protein
MRLIHARRRASGAPDEPGPLPHRPLREDIRRFRQVHTAWLGDPGLGQSWESARSRSGMGMSGPCSCIKRLTLALPWRGQKLQAMWMVAQVLGDFAEQDGAAGGHLVPGLPPAQKQAHLCRLMRLLCRMVICPPATPQPAGVSIPRTLSRFEDIRGQTPGGLDRHALRAGGGDKTKQNPRLDAPRAKGVAVVRHYRASGAEPLAINIRPGQIIRAFVHLAATSIEQIERAAKGTNLGIRLLHPPDSSPGNTPASSHANRRDEVGLIVRKTTVLAPERKLRCQAKLAVLQAKASKTSRRRRRATGPGPSQQRVVLIHSCGMPCIIASSSAANRPSTISSMRASACSGSSTLPVFASRLVMAALTLSAQLTTPELPELRPSRFPARAILGQGNDADLLLALLYLGSELLKPLSENDFKRTHGFFIANLRFLGHAVTSELIISSA